MTKPVQSTHGVQLPPQYEIRLLTPSMASCVLALTNYAACFQSPVTRPAYTGRRGYICAAMQLVASRKEMIANILEKGMSYGIFDTSHVFADPSPEVEAAAGVVKWDDLTPADLDSDNVAEQRLLERIDTSLVSLALAGDMYSPPPVSESTPEAVAAAAAAPKPSPFPYKDELNAFVASHDPRDPTSWKPTRPGQVVSRMGTLTIPRCQGQGLMKAMAWFFMAEVRERGFETVSIDCIHDGVKRTWMNPPAPAQTTLVYEVSLQGVECKSQDGKVTRPFTSVATPKYAVLSVKL